MQLHTHTANLFRYGSKIQFGNLQMLERIPPSRYGHSKVIRLLEQHMGKAGDNKGVDATDGRGLLRLKRT